MDDANAVLCGVLCPSWLHAWSCLCMVCAQVLHGYIQIMALKAHLHRLV